MWLLAPFAVLYGIVSGCMTCLVFFGWLCWLVKNADMKNGSHTMQLDTVRYCAFADPGQVQEGDTKVGLASMDIEEASEFFRNTSTNYSNLF